MLSVSHESLGLIAVEYGEYTVAAEPSGDRTEAGEYGDCGIWSRLGVRAECGRGNPGVGGMAVFIASGRSCLLMPWFAIFVLSSSLKTASLTEDSL